jgi:hypothetical protein
VAQVFQPLKIRYGHAACVQEHIRNNDYAFFGKNFIRIGSERAISAFADDFCLDTRCV